MGAQLHQRRLAIMQAASADRHLPPPKEPSRPLVPMKSWNQSGTACDPIADAGGAMLGCLLEGRDWGAGCRLRERFVKVVRPESRAVHH
jgi:hypothetical protein